MLLLHDAGGRPPGARLSDDDLVQLYRWPDAGALRSNFVTSLDGSIQGADGRSGGINTESDHQVFALHRALCDVVLVAAGTARAEGYRAVDLQPWQSELRSRLGLTPFPSLVVVSVSGRLEPSVATPAEGEGGPVLLVTTAGKPAEALAPLRAAGVEVWEEPGDDLDLADVLHRLAGRGLLRVLCEGGPRLHRDLLAAGLLDELSLTLAPLVVGGDGARTTSGPGLQPAPGFALELAVLADDGALFTRYRRG